MDSRAIGPETVSLPAWLAELAAFAEPIVLLGGTGHLDLGVDEQQRAAHEIEQEVLPLVAALPRPRSWC